MSERKEDLPRCGAKYSKFICTLHEGHGGEHHTDTRFPYHWLRRLSAAPPVPASGGAREMLQRLVADLNAYAGKNGLGPHRIMHTLADAEALLAALSPAPASQSEQPGRVTVEQVRNAVESSIDYSMESRAHIDLKRLHEKLNAALASPGSQPPEADLEYLRNLAATDISKEIPLTDAQFNWLQERLRKLVRRDFARGKCVRER